MRPTKALRSCAEFGLQMDETNQHKGRCLWEGLEDGDL